MKTYKIITEAYSMEYQAADVEEALNLYAVEAGYAVFDDLADRLGVTRSQALADLIVKEISDDGTEWVINF